MPVIRKELEVEDGTKLYSSFERSLRRALQRMVSDGGVIAIGGGGPADPYRYFMDPLLIAIASKSRKKDTLGSMHSLPTPERLKL